MSFLLICISAAAASLLTLFSGFGLGTLLMPVFALFFPLDLAIAMTGVVHLFNNMFKLSLLGKSANRDIVLRFGIPAIVCAFVGAYLLFFLDKLPALYTYSAWGKTWAVSPIKLIVAVLMIFFSLMEIVPRLKNLQFDRKHLVVGGMLSGLLGGLSGHQGALRSAFLIRSGLSATAFIATGVVIACLVDVARLAVYFNRYAQQGITDNIYLLTAATLSAFVGAYVGSKLIKKITLSLVQWIVAIMMMLLAVMLGLGWI